MSRILFLAVTVGVLALAGCTCVLVENTDSTGDPVVLSFSTNPLNQPNPGLLDADTAAEFEFPDGTVNVSIHGYDPLFTSANDDITVDFPRIGCRYVEWDGFNLINRGVAFVPLAQGLMTGRIQAHVVTPPSTPPAE